MKRICIILAFVLISVFCVSCKPSNPADSSNPSSDNTSSSVSPVNISIPESLVYSFDIVEHSERYSYEGKFVASFENYFICENILYSFENNTVKKVTELTGIGDVLTTEFVIRNNCIYYAAEQDKSDADNSNIYKRNLIDNTEEIIYEGYVFFIKLKDDLIYFNGYNSKASGCRLGVIDANDNVSFVGSLQLGLYDTYGDLAFVNDEMFLHYDGYITKWNSNINLSILDINAIYSGKNEIYTARKDLDADEFQFFVCDTSLEKATKFAECDMYVRGYAFGDRKVVYLTDNGVLCITDGVETKMLLTGLSKDIISWQIIDDTFYWFVSSDNHGTVKLKQ